MSEKKTKTELLEHYATKQPTEFWQYDGFINVVADCVMRPDADGETVFGGETTELMSGADVRVLVPKNSPIDRDQTIRLLAKISDWIARDGVGAEGSDPNEIPF